MFIDLIERPIGRRPGSLCKFKCALCGAVELVTGGKMQPQMQLIYPHLRKPAQQDGA